jgi:hypothetical protein
MEMIGDRISCILTHLSLLDQKSGNWAVEFALFLPNNGFEICCHIESLEHSLAQGREVDRLSHTEFTNHA